MAFDAIIPQPHERSEDAPCFDIWREMSPLQDVIGASPTTNPLKMAPLEEGNRFGIAGENDLQHRASPPENPATVDTPQAGTHEGERSAKWLSALCSFFAGACCNSY